ncbi:GDSL-type esterase/lipase family protein [Paenarthrobacter sp. NPDC058040]|uniref:GDSL-type esterase/lipase family protein n=1 Tax=unclassified Paenarthrobacter TaxID=2634190 RepID=UPI0036DBB5C6
MSARGQAAMKGQQLLGRALGSLMRTPMRMRRDQLTRLPLPAGRVLFLGDSITEQGMWHEWFPDVPTLNRGVGGDTVQGVRQRLDSAVNQPLLISLLIGTNDLGGLGTTQPAALAAQFSDLVVELRALAPDAVLVINSVMPRTPHFASTIQDLNVRYQDIAAREGASFLNLWPILASPDGGLRSEFTADNLHLNGAGYEAWTKTLLPSLESLLGTGRSVHHRSL